MICLNQIFYPQSIQAEDLHDGCTIGVAAGSATSDGRPLLWKTRDGGRSKYNNEVSYITFHKYKFIMQSGMNEPRQEFLASVGTV